MPDKTILSNPAFLKKFNEVLDGLGMTQTLKADPGIIDSSVNFSGTMPKPAVVALLDQTISESEVLSAIDMKKVTSKKGEVRIMDISGPVSEAVGENDGTPVLNRPNTSVKEYSCGKMKAEIDITTEELEAAGEDGIANFQDNLMNDFSTCLGNDLAHIVFRGNKTLSKTSPDRWDRMLRRCDGLSRLCDAGANVIDNDGVGVGLGMFHVFKQSLPTKYAQNIGLYRWLLNSQTMDLWRMIFADKRPTAEGDKRLSGIIPESPAGVNPLTCNTILGDLGVTGTPDAVTDGTTVIKSRCNAILPDAGVAAHVGRKVLLTYLPTGKSELCTVYKNGSNKCEITTSTGNLLGQTAVSTTAAEYSIKISDETEIYLGPPKSFALVSTTHNWRSHYRFNPSFDRHEFTFYYWLDSLLATPEAWVKVKEMKLQSPPSYTEWSGWAS